MVVPSSSSHTSKITSSSDTTRVDGTPKTSGVSNTEIRAEADEVGGIDVVEKDLGNSSTRPKLGLFGNGTPEQITANATEEDADVPSSKEQAATPDRGSKETCIVQGETHPTKDQGEVKPSEGDQGDSPEPDYSSFTPWQKKLIVLSATLGGFFSPFTAQIYFPALTTIAQDLNVSNSKINLTMTTYMILQATAPAFIGGFSDKAGRRPAVIVCFIIYIAADIALGIQNDYVALLILRMVQSAGSSGTVAIAMAIVADIATSAERGIYIGITSISNILAPSIGPILGGILSQYAGWHWIFWFLTILGSAYFIPFVLFMPETCRLIVGDGSVPPPLWNRSLFSHIQHNLAKIKAKKQNITLPPPDYAARDELRRLRGPLRFPNPLKTLEIALEKECFLILFFAGIVYAGFYAVISAMPSQLKDIYGFDELVVGLMYLPIAGGSIIAAFTMGKLIDYSFHREALKRGMTTKKTKQTDLRGFPIEMVRIRVAIPLLILAMSMTIIYGWVLHIRASVGYVCVLLFFIGFGLVGATQTVSILIVDINPGLAGTATAAYNLIRCLLGAGATAIILPIIDRIGSGWAFTVVAASVVFVSPCLVSVLKWGPTWREARRVRDEEKKRVKDEERERERAVDEKV